MVAEVLDLVVAVEVEVLTAMEVRILRVGVLNAVLIQVRPGPVNDPLIHLPILGPSDLQVGSVPNGQYVAAAVLEVVSLRVVVEGQVGEVSAG